MATQDSSQLSLQLINIYKNFGNGTRNIEVLRDVSFTMQQGESLAILGPSGSGKSTLLHLIGTLDQPSSGTI
ncbi:MAG: ATP-binding cassette domain-containing protein, partial [Chlorobi bacterium CHB1]|nr:ATP-binding cassette domain-containing protein [Chlorobi bacterium CHB1]